MSHPNDPTAEQLASAALARFGQTFNVPNGVPNAAELLRMLTHSSHRRWTEQAIEPDLLRLLFACALAAPSKSDLQQADIIQVTDREKIKAIASFIPDMPWINDAPVFLVFCGNNRRIRQIGEWRGKPFANEHLDHFMNAAVDAGLVLAQFIRAAEAVGLGTVPISAVRNYSRETSDLLGLPEAVFPIAGLCVGYPVEGGRIIPRLSLDTTVHTDQFNEADVRTQVDEYDQRRHALFPLRKQRYASHYSDVELNGWSEDKARHYSMPERDNFGEYIRAQKFSLK